MNTINKRTLLIISGIVVVVLSVVFALFFLKIKNTSYILGEVQKGDVIQEILANGKVESPTSINLRFKNSGKLVFLNTKVGEKISVGRLLAKQDTTELDAQVKEMQAGIDLQKAKLNQLLGGASDEDVKLSEIKLENARRKLYSDDLIAVSDDETRRSVVPVVTGKYNGTQEGHYEVFFRDFNDLYSRNIISFIGLERGIAEKDDLPKTFGTKGLSIAFPNASYQYNDRWTIDIPNKNGINYVSNLNAYNTALAELALKKAPIRELDVKVYQAQISQAEASLQKIQAQREELAIFSPISGVVTEVNGEVGENIGPEETVISFATDGALQIKLNVVEDNIVNVQIGQEARILFDAIEKQEFKGKVVAIDPAETVIGGAVYYQTTILFDEKDERIKSGMTANVWIKTATSDNTLFIPVSAIRKKDNRMTVQVLEGNQILDKEIVMGIESGAGMVEVISGLSEGEKIILGDK
jgi:multidrug efflux pump subunit AcrA (membrane-fusion protein)